MKIKPITGAIVTIILLSVAVLFWYFSPSDVSIVSLEAPEEIGMNDVNYLNISIQNNASKDVNVTINVKNSFVDEKGVSLKEVQILEYENLSYKLSNITDKPQKEVLLKPGSNSIMVMVGYQVAGPQKVDVEVYQHGKLADSGTIEIKVLPAKIAMKVWNYRGFNGTNEIHTIYGYLENSGKGSASGVVVNISVINEITNTTVSTVIRNYTISSYIDLLKMGRTYEPLVVWSSRNITEDPVTGMRNTITIETIAPVVVIELSKNTSSDEKYIMSPVVVKGKLGDRYKVVVTAMWRDQLVSSEVRIPP
ncbi:MAG TPA: hypothetical protein VJJ51_08080 [Candidatus Methanoperedens sp.]|nr:hypothetical protein [Candidatus Methanoperedens sp.]HLB70988.1 hypothetical protein [Candidatus Methanoperedens sp.]